MTVGPRKFCNLVLAWVFERLPDEEKRAQWLYEMDQPLPWESSTEVSQAQLQKEAAEFMSSMQQFG